MNPSGIEELTSQPKASPKDLEVRLTELRSRGASILKCIKYVYLNQACSLADAKTIVVDSRAWADQKDQFLRHQEKILEECLTDNKVRIESIEQSITLNGTKVVVHLKASD